MLTDAKSASHLSHNHFAGGDSAFSIVLNGIIDDDTVKTSSAQVSGLLAHLEACQQTDVTRRATNAFIRTAGCST
jgi:hypothetical protein